MMLTSEQIAEITNDVWNSLVEIPLEPGAGAAAGDGVDLVTGCVHITGAWDGSVFVELHPGTARTLATGMFGTEELSEDEVGDAIGELANMVGGNVKSLMPEPSRLSLPTVTAGGAYHQRVAGAQRLHHVVLSAAGDPVVVSVWSRPDGGLEDNQEG